MKKFEYRVLLADWATCERLLNQEGRNGWELVGNTREEYPTDNKKNNQVMLTLKRLMSV